MANSFLELLTYDPLLCGYVMVTTEGKKIMVYRDSDLARKAEENDE
jgi:hypothetical protein